MALAVWLDCAEDWVLLFTPEWRDAGLPDVPPSPKSILSPLAYGLTLLPLFAGLSAVVALYWFISEDSLSDFRGQSALYYCEGRPVLSLFATFAENHDNPTMLLLKK